MTIKYIDLFCGTGAFSYVLDKKNCECVFANDMVKESESIYNLNHPKDDIFNLNDLNDIETKDIPKHDLLCGGFPCQPFSIAGEQKGFEDKRANVFWKIIDILEHHKPKFVILENVKNLTSHDKGNTFKTIKEKLEKLKYYIKPKVLDTSKITKVPQHRERIYIIGFLKKKDYDKFNFDFPEVENQNISDLLEEEIPDKYYYTNKLKENVYEEVKNNVTKHVNTNTVYQYRRYYVRENKSNCCPTLTANMGGGGHNVPLIKDDKGIRKLTPRECFNLQGFPKDYKLKDNNEIVKTKNIIKQTKNKIKVLQKDNKKEIEKAKSELKSANDKLKQLQLSDTKLYKLAGNAVSIPVVELIVNKLI